MLLTTWAAAGGCAVRSRLPQPPPKGPTHGLGESLPADESLAIEGLDGKPVRPLDVGAAQTHLVVFVTTDCPIANAYAPELRRMARDYGPRGVRLFLVHTLPEIEVDDARRHARSYDLPGTVAIDRDHALVRALSVTRTPEAALIVSGPRLAYRGRIDNLFADLGVRRPTGATQFDLRDALERTLAGEPAARPWEPAVGCDVPQR